MKPIAYEGSENYIFISYAHKDSDMVLRILEQMDLRGYNIWYDDGIAPGSEWPENIAEHLTGSALVLAFISNNSIASANCRREVTFALAKQKKFLGVLLEPTQMSPGMEMQLSAQQCIMRYNYTREEDFIRKLLACPELDDCKRQEPVPEEIPVAEAPVTLPPEKPEKPKRAPKPPRKAKKRPKLWIVLGVVLAVLVVLTAAILLSRVTIVPGETVGRNVTYISLYDSQITPQTVSKLNKLKHLEDLYLYDCTIENDALSGLNAPNLETLTLSGTTGQTDYTFLEACPNLSILRLEGCGVTDDNLVLAEGTQLWTLNLSGNPEFTDLSRFDAVRLGYLTLDGTSVSDLSCLAGAEQLREIYCNDTPVSDISVLASMKDLTTLSFRNCAITQITEPIHSLSVRHIDFSGNALTDCSGLASLTVLETVRLDNNDLTDISWLEKSVATLKEVSVSQNPLDSTDLAFLSGAANLTKLRLDGIPLTDLSLVRDLVLLTELSAKNCGIADISDLALLSGLETIYLSGNAISDLTGLPDLAESSYPVLDLAYNQIADVSAIAGNYYKILTLHGNPLVYSDASFKDMEGQCLTLNYDPSITACGDLGFNEIYLQDCPLDQQLQVEDVLGYGVQFVTHEEILSTLEEEEIYY